MKRGPTETISIQDLSTMLQKQRQPLHGFFIAKRFAQKDQRTISAFRWSIDQDSFFEKRTGPIEIVRKYSVVNRTIAIAIEMVERFNVIRRVHTTSPSLLLLGSHYLRRKSKLSIGILPTRGEWCRKAV